MAETFGTTIEADVELWNETDSFLYWLFYVVALLTTTIIFIFHSFKLWSDLCSAERSSLKHQKKKPALTTKYKWTNYLTHLCVFLYVIYLLVCSIQMTDSNYSQCVVTTYD